MQTRTESAEWIAVTRRAEEIRETTGCSWERACQDAEGERDFEAKFPESTYKFGSVVVHCTGPNHDAVMWMSDWCRWPELVEAGHLRAEFGGPETYGHTSLYIAEQPARCGCPDDCNCRAAWRTNYCGCKAHA